MEEQKVIIVEGKSDKAKLEQLLDEPVQVLCTNGTLSSARLEEIVLEAEDKQVYILVDADEPGNKLRLQLLRELPNARQLYTKLMFREVASTPNVYLAKILTDAHFIIKQDTPFN